MHLTEVFKESLSLLKREPKVFVPRIFTTGLYTFFVLYLASLGLKISLAINQGVEAAESAGTVPDLEGILSLFSRELLLFACLFLFVSAVDILTYGMYVQITKDFHAKKPISLTNALKDAVSRARTLLLIGVLATGFVGCFVGV
ncbi:MAG: hypothetical protein V3V36_00585, partial [Candidatus Hydrothermarchaeaceae archaeon]